MFAKTVNNQQMDIIKRSVSTFNIYLYHHYLYSVYTASLVYNSVVLLEPLALYFVIKWLNCTRMS